MNQGEIVKTKAMTLSFQNLEEYSSFITAPPIQQRSPGDEDFHHGGC